MSHSFDEQTPDAKKAALVLDCVAQISRQDLGYDFFTSKMIWGVSLYLSTGKFRVLNWNKYHRFSDEALQLKEREPKLWRKGVTFEHARPIQQIYKMMVAKGTSLDRNAAAQIISEYEPVIITKAENTIIDKNKHRIVGLPEDRYAHIKLSFPLRSEQRL